MYIPHRRGNYRCTAGYRPSYICIERLEGNVLPIYMHNDHGFNSFPAGAVIGNLRYHHSHF